MVKKVIISTSVFFLLGFTFMAFYGFNPSPGTGTTVFEESIDAYEPVVVLELFTSQGCSSCPPADALLDKVKKEYPKEVFALSYHVDYWNYIGWDDPFSKSAYTKKQTLYNRKFRYRSNYTPELVVNGKEHFVGSSSSKMYAKIEVYKNIKASNRVTIDKAVKQDNTIEFEYTIAGNTLGKELRAVLVLNERTTSVKRGENRNRTLKNSNIVVAEKYFLANSKGSGAIEIPSIVSAKDDLSLMLISETENADITGAVKTKI